MARTNRGRLRTSLIDFSLPASTEHFELQQTLSHGGVHAFRGHLEPHEDGLIGGSQLSVVVHESESHHERRGCYPRCHIAHSHPVWSK